MSDRPELDEYLRLISHELKSPINAIKALLDTVIEGYAGNIEERTRFIIEKAVRRSEEAEEIITDLMRFERYSDSVLENPEPVRLGALARNLAERYAAEAADRGISLRADFPEDCEYVVAGDSGALEHALRNLLENAVKYTEAGGSISVRISSDRDETLVTVEVGDTGAGIREEDRERIFTPFFRAASATKTAGTGLGLPIVAKVIENHHGRVDVESRLGEGSRFSIVLPIGSVEKFSPTPGKTRVVIIGGVTAGPKTAARLRRLDEDLDITIVEQNEFLSYSGCGLPWYISGRVESPRELMSSGDSTVRDISFFEAIDNIHIVNKTRVERIDRHQKKLHLASRDSGRSELDYDVLVLATGASPNIPSIRGIDIPGVFTLRSVEDAERIKKALAGGHSRDLYFIGGGLVGISTADEIIKTGTRITILEKKEYILQKLFDRDLAKRIEVGLSVLGIRVHTETEVTEIRTNQGRIEIVTDRAIYDADLVVLSAGVTPNSELAAEANLDIGCSGGIVVDSHLRTSDESIYAVGDCVESLHSVTGSADYWPLGSVSTKMGRIAADNICGRKVEFTGHAATTMYRLQGMTVARTGVTTRIAFKQGFNASAMVVVGNDRAHYEPDSGVVTLKIIAENKSGIILGAQGYGAGEVVSRIQLFASAIANRVTLNDFFMLDLGYSPTFNTAIDISQTAAITLANKIEGLIETVHPDEIDHETGEFRSVPSTTADSGIAKPPVFVSVCPIRDFHRFEIPGSINVPLERLRLDHLPYERDREIILYSRTSAGAYNAYRYLSARGYERVRVLEGGFLFYQQIF